MGQILHGSARTTEAVRRTIQHSQESLRVLARRHGINQKTVAKWKNRTSATDLPTGPREPRSTVLSVEDEAIIVALRRHTLLPLDDCLYALQPTIPHLTRSSLHRCLARHGISRLPEVEGDKPAEKRFKAYPIGYLHIDIAEVLALPGMERAQRAAVVELRRLLERAPSHAPDGALSQCRAGGEAGFGTNPLKPLCHLRRKRPDSRAGWGRSAPGGRRRDRCQLSRPAR